MNAADGADPHRPVVLLAVPRSGSQLLRTVLNAHPELFIAAYSNLLGVLANPEMDLEEIEEILRYEHQETCRTREHVLELLPRIHRDFWMTSGELDRLGKSRLAAWGFIQYVLPLARQSLPLSHLFPRGRFIHLVRDGRSVVASWMSNWEVAANRMPVARRDAGEVARLWTEWVRGAAQYATLTVRLEDLHRDESRAATVNALLSHCGVGPHPAVTPLVQRLPWVNYEKQRLDRWREDLDRRTLERLYAVEGFTAALAAHGYEVC